MGTWRRCASASARSTGAARNGEIRSEKNQETEAAITTKATERISRRRSSSRCSRKDIWPPSSSSLPLFVESALKNADIAARLEPFLFAERIGCGFGCGCYGLRGCEWLSRFRDWFWRTAARDDQLGIGGCCHQWLRYRFLFDVSLRFGCWKNRVFRFVLRFFHSDFAFPCTLEIVRCFTELSETFADRTRELRQFAWPKKYQSDDQNKEQLSTAERFQNEGKHGLSYLPKKLRIVISLRCARSRS